jgi:hypothetical protein
MKNSRNEKWTGRKFKVTVHLPDGISESVRQSKIDRLYDILKSNAAENKNDEKDDENDNNNT